MTTTPDYDLDEVKTVHSDNEWLPQVQTRGQQLVDTSHFHCEIVMCREIILLWQRCLCQTYLMRFQPLQSPP